MNCGCGLFHQGGSIGSYRRHCYSWQIKGNIQGLPVETIPGRIHTVISHIHIYTEKAVGAASGYPPAIEHEPVIVSRARPVVVAHAENRMPATTPVRNITELIHVIDIALIAIAPEVIKVAPGIIRGQEEGKPGSPVLVENVLDIANGCRPVHRLGGDSHVGDRGDGVSGSGGD